MRNIQEILEEVSKRAVVEKRLKDELDNQKFQELKPYSMN